MPWPLRMVLTIFALSLVLHLYVSWRLSGALSTLLPEHVRLIRRCVGLALLLISLYPILIIGYHLSGNLDGLFVFSNEGHIADYFALYPFWIGLIVVVEVAPYYLLTDLVHLGLRLFSKELLVQWTGKLATVKAGIFFLALVIIGSRSYLDTNRVQIADFDVPVANLPKSAEDLRIALISDIQIDRYTGAAQMERMQSKLRDIDPDLIFFAGDAVTQGKHFIPEAVAALGATEASVERIACLGDHDYWSGAEEVRTGLREGGWTFLENQHHVIEHNGSRILVTGITHIYSQRIQPGTLDALLSEAPAADIKILLVHQPANSVIRIAEQHGYDVLLAGHTHGGQLVFRPFGAKLSPIRAENTYFTGHGQAGDLQVIVTNGIGFTLAPLRYGAAAEVVSIRLKAGP